MSFPARRTVATRARNLHTVSCIAGLSKSWRIRHPLAFSRSGNPHWICETSAATTTSSSTVEIHYEWEAQDGNYTKYRMKRWVDGVETEKRGFSSKSGQEQTSEREEEIDWITMRRKQQKKHEAPAIRVDERGFEKGVERKVEENQLGDAFARPPQREPQRPSPEEKQADAATFQMPPPTAPKSTAPTASAAQTSAPSSNANTPGGTRVFKNTSRTSPPDVAKAEAATTSSKPPSPLPPALGPAPRPIRLTPVPHPDIGLPRNPQTPTGLFVPRSAKPSSEGASWSWEPAGDPTGAKSVDAAWEGAAAEAKKSATAAKTAPTPTPTSRPATVREGDENLDFLLPSHIRAAMARHTPSTYSTAYPETGAHGGGAHEGLEKDSWHESFGTPADPAAEAYTTVHLAPFTFAATSSTPLPLLRAHTISFLSQSPASTSNNSSTTTPPEEEDWHGFDLMPSMDAENTFVFLLYPQGATQPYLALCTMPDEIRTPIAELKPTEALDFLTHAGTFLPFLRAGRAQGGRLLHATREGVSWGVFDKREGWRVIRALEKVAAKDERTECELDREVPRGDLGKIEKPRKGGALRRMFWAGVWVGGLTGLMGAWGGL